MSRQMKDSGIPWIGDIPNHWQLKKLKFSCRLYGRIGFRGYTADDLVANGEGAITLSPTNMNGITLDLTKCSYLSWEKYFESPEIMVQNGDVLLVKTASVGKCCYVDNLPMETTVNPQILVLKNHKDYFKFIAYIFQTSIGQSYIDITKGGSTIYTISQEKIGNYEFAFPSLQEQKSIADFLDKKCSLIDALISLQEKMIEELKAYKQSVITEAVTKGLNPDVPMKDSGIDYLGMVNNSYSISRLIFYLNLLTDGTHQTPEYIESGIPFLSIKDMSSGSLDFTNVKYISEAEHLELSKHANIERDDILFSRIGTMGVFVKVNTDTPFDIFVSLGLMKVKKEKINTDYLVYYLSSSCVLNYINKVKAGGGTSAAKFNLGDVSRTMILLPSKQEQNEIVSYLDKKCSEIDSLISLKLSKIEKLKEYKKSLIYEYVTGKKEIEA